MLKVVKSKQNWDSHDVVQILVDNFFCKSQLNIILTSAVLSKSGWNEVKKPIDLYKKYYIFLATYFVD